MFDNLFRPHHTNEWVIDTASTHHLCNEKGWFLSYTPLQNDILLGEGKSRAEGYGDIPMEISKQKYKYAFTLKNVLHTPHMVKNLISGRLLDEHGCKLVFADRTCLVYHPEGHIVFKAKLNNNFYKIETRVLSEGKSESKWAQVYHAYNKNETLKLWHQRLGHVNIEDLNYMSRNEMFSGLTQLNGDMKPCESCQLSKSITQSYPRLEAFRSNKLLQPIHSDVWGPAPVASLGGARYYVTFIDDFSRHITVYPIARKNMVLHCFEIYKTRVENETGKRMRTIRTDNGTEYCNQAFEHFCSKAGIKHETTNTYSPQMNGIAERVNRTLVDMARTMMKDAKLPMYLWAELIVTSAYLKNRLKHSKLGGKVPLEYWTGRKPSCRHLKKIGCQAYVHVPKQRRRNKFQNRAEKGVLVGYAKRTKGYRIYYPDLRDVRESKHVNFNEHQLGCVTELDRTPAPDTYTFYDADNAPESESETELNATNLRFEATQGTNIVERDTGMQETDTKNQRENAISRNLPPGWKQLINVRQEGKTRGTIDIYYVPPTGKKRLRSEPEVKAYLRSNSLDHDIKLFNFCKKEVLSSLNAQQDEIQDGVKEENLPAMQATATKEREEETFHEAIESHCTEVLIPKSYEEALQSPEREYWQSAMDSEIRTLHERNVIQNISKPASKKIIGCRWIYDIKTDSQGKVLRYKARLVAQGYNQKPGLDYNETFSPVVNFTLIRLFIALFVVTLGWSHNHLDVKNAYLYGYLPEEIYMKQIPGFELGNSSSHCLRLLKALYGLPQSGRVWYRELDRSFNNLGFMKLPGTNCVYFIPMKVLVLVYVDDLAVIARDDKTLEEVYQTLSSVYEMKNLGPIRRFLGVEFETDDNGRMKLHQITYIKKIMEKFRINQEVPVSLPLNPNFKLDRSECPTTDEDRETMKMHPYQGLIGSLLFLALRTRPDILYAVITLSQVNATPGVTHWTHLCQLARYVNSTRHYSLHYTKRNDSRITMYSDSDWGKDCDTRRSACGYVCYWGSSPFSWRSFKQKSVAQSTMEAEYVALAEATKELSWLTTITNSIAEQFKLDIPIPLMLCDNQSAIFYAKNPVENNRTKHIDIRYHFIREKLEDNLIELKHVPTKKNAADIFTKPLAKLNFENCRDMLNLI